MWDLLCLAAVVGVMVPGYLLVARAARRAENIPTRLEQTVREALVWDAERLMLRDADRERR